MYGILALALIFYLILSSMFGWKRAELDKKLWKTALVIFIAVTPVVNEIALVAFIIYLLIKNCNK